MEADFSRSYSQGPDEAWARLQQAAIEHSRAVRARVDARYLPVLSTDGGPAALRISLGFAALVGTLEPAAGGCRLRGRIGLHPNFRKARPVVIALFVLLFWRQLSMTGIASMGGAAAAASLIYPLTFVAMLYFAFAQAPRRAAAHATELGRLIDAFLPGAAPTA